MLFSSTMSYYIHPHSIIDRIMAKRWSFLGVFALVFFFSYLFLVAIDFVPEPPGPAAIEQTPVRERPSTRIIQEAAVIGVAETTETEEIEEIEAELELPQSLYIKRLNREVAILNPASREISDLDEALLSGTVRHPDSAALGQNGNVFVLGHSSYLPQVLNKNFQAFNGIEDLEWGDIIEVTGENNVFVYRVEDVYEAKATDATVIPIRTDDRRLTLATCDSFGSVEDRFIVEAVEIAVRPL